MSTRHPNPLETELGSTVRLSRLQPPIPTARYSSFVE